LKVPGTPIRSDIRAAVSVREVSMSWQQAPPDVFARLAAHETYEVALRIEVISKELRPGGHDELGKGVPA